MTENFIHCGDALKVLSLLQDKSVDLVFADPPYFLSKTGGTTCKSGKRSDVSKGEWDRPTTVQEIHEWNTAWLSECARVTVPTGTIWVSGTFHNINSVGFAMQQLGFRILNDVTWKKPIPPPNLGCRTFTHSTERILWASPYQRTKYVFRYDDMRRTAGGRQMKDLWEFMPPDLGEIAHGRHPTQKPEALLERIILASSKPNALVLDLFCGSGTTSVIAKRTGRRWIAIDVSPRWCRVTRARLKATDVQMDLFEKRKVVDEPRR